MTIMDPWNISTNDKKSDAIIDQQNQYTFPHEFEDNFEPSKVNNPLPDSDNYLAKLEEKLEKIRNDPSILKQLIEKREACMQQLLLRNTNYQLDDNFDDPLNNSQILRTLLPQKQALNHGELVELLKYDQLFLNNNELTESN